MAIVDLQSYLLWPPPLYAPGVLKIDSGFALEHWSVSPKVAFICKVPKSGTLDRAEFLLLNTGAKPIRLSFQDLTGSAPDGVQDQYRDLPAMTIGWIVPGLMTSDGTDTGTKRTVTKGDWVAIVFEFTGTVGDHAYGMFIDLNLGASSGNMAGRTAEVYWATYNGSAWVATGGGIAPNFALKYSDGSYARFFGPVAPVSSQATETFGSGSTPNEIGMTFSLTAAMRVAGAWVVIDQDATADVLIYDTNGTTVLKTASLPAGGPRSQNQLIPLFVRFATDLDLAAGTNYRLAVKATSASTLGLQVFTLAASALREAHPGGLQVQYTSRSGGAWTETGTKLPLMALVVTGLDTGGSAVVVNPEVATELGV